MARNYVPQLSEFPYHITARCPNRDAFRTSLADTWTIFEQNLSYVNFKYNFKIHSFVLMPNHFHMIASVQEYPIGYIMRELLSETSKEMNRRTGRINQNWGGRYFKCAMESSNYITNAYKYVYQNPLRAGLVHKCESWPYSTLNQILGFSRLRIPIENDTILFNPEFDQAELDWVNKPINSEHLNDFKLALKKSKFKFAYDRNNKFHFLESNRI